MVISTRSGSRSPTKKTPSEAKASGENPHQEQLHHFILPKYTSEKTRFVLLRHPRDSSLQRFLFCPERGLYQFTKISAAPNDSRSLLFIPSSDDDDQADKGQDGGQTVDGNIRKTAEIFVATPFDLVFLLMALVMPVKAPAGKALFQPLEDILEEHVQEDRTLRYLFENGKLLFEKAMSSFCDTIEAGDEHMFRPNEQKTLQLILSKVDAAIRAGLPSSMEEKFVIRALEAPILSVKREEATISSVKIKTKSIAPDDEGDEEELDSFESQSSATDSALETVLSEILTTTSVSTVGSESMSPELLRLQKERMVFDFILASYVPDGIADRLKARLTTKDSPINFGPLDEHLKSLAVLRAEALSSRSVGDFSRKRGLEDDETAELRAEKKRKQEDEDRKKRLGESNGVRALKKVNVVGMKKMSDFFTKKPAAKVG